MSMLKWECWGYKNGKPEWHVYVTAKTRADAESLAWDKLRNLGRNPERVTVK